MKQAVDLFTELGRRLANFGQDAVSRRVITCAQQANAWFTHDDIIRSVSALRDQMLCHRSLTEWLGHYAVPTTVPRRVLVVMAGNIPLVGFFDLMCVVASGHHCIVKPAAKDTVLMEYIVWLLHEIDPKVPILFANSDAVSADAVIATGSDNANRYFKTRYGDMPSLLRGSRQSVAVLSGQETPEQLKGLSDDIFAYSGLGCRNVSLVFVPRGKELQLQTPPMNSGYHNNYLQTKALLEMTGIAFRDINEALLVENREFPSALSTIHYTFYDTLAEVEQWLTEHDEELQCVVSECVCHARRTDFGHAQSPRLTDYPDDRDVIEFLLTIN